MDIEQESVILKLYEQSEQEMSNSKDYAELLSKYNTYKVKFRAEITENQSQGLEKLLQFKTDMESITARDYYIEGFKVATRLMAEAFSKKEK